MTPRRPLILGTVIALVLALIAPAAASAALPDPEPAAVTAVASLEKTASVTEVGPDTLFTYTLTVGCSSITDNGCRGAVLTDAVPAPFELVDAVVGAGTNTAADPVISGNSVSVTWTTDLGDGTTGLLDATTGIVQITARLPEGASYDLTGIPVTNEAVIEGSNVVDVRDQVDVTPLIPLQLATTAGKSLAPASLIAEPGTAVTATLTATNDSNATVDRLVIQDPAGDPAATPNPLEDLGFRAFGAVTPPAGATATAYEVWVAPGGWVALGADGSLPPQIDPAQVRGTRVSFTGAIPSASTGAVALDLALTDAAAARPDGDRVPNSASSTVGLGGQTATDDATAEVTLRQRTITMSAGKSFSPGVVVAGDTSIVTLQGANSSTIPIETMTISEPAAGVFPAAYAFAGITAPISYPLGATAGSIAYTLADGTIVTSSFADGAVPPAPPGAESDVVSFQVAFTGSIPPGGETEIPFAVQTDPALGGLPLTVPNEISVTGQNGGAIGTATATDDLYVYDEIVEPYVAKSLRPAQIVAAPGQVVTVSLQGGLTERPAPPERPTGSTGDAQRVILQDPPDPVAPDAWWNAFDLVAVTQTPVPADAALTVEYYDAATGTWVALAGPIAGPTIYSGAVAADVAAAAGGIRFVYDWTGSPDRGFPPGVDFAPNFTAEVRAEGRYEAGPPFSGENPTVIADCAQASASASDAADATVVTPAEECPEVELVPVDPGAVDLIDKTFGTSSSGGIKTVIARSGDTIPSVLRWGTNGFSGIDEMRIADVADPAGTPLDRSVYDAFDLVRVQPITPASDPLIAYDQVSRVEVWNGSGWVRAANDPCPAACAGTFPGVALTVPERASTTGIRLVFAESPARAAATAGDLDAPPVGSGVARSFGAVRPITLVWQVRDTRRSDATPVLGDELYNLTAEGLVRNTVRADAVQGGAVILTSDDADDVLIIDVPLTTTTDKNWSGGPLAAPVDPTVAPQQFPTSRLTVTTRNTTPAKVDRLQITDPAPGSVISRQDDPFQAFTLDDIVQISQPAGTTSTVVTLSCPDGTSRQYSRTAALNLTAATMPCDVTGLTVAFDGRISSGAAGVIVFDVRLRPWWRYQPTERVSLGTSPIGNTAEGVVADVDPPGACPPPADARWACDQGSASIAIAAPTFTVTAGKSITPASQKEDDFAPVTVRLQAQPGGTIRPVSLTLEDADASFWNAVDFVGMDPSWAFVPPTQVVRVCYLSGGSFTPDTVTAGTVGGLWTCSAPFTSIASASTYLAGASVGADIHGLRFEVSTANGLGWQNPSTPVVSVPFLVERRVDLRSGGPVPTTRADQIAAPGEAQAGVFVDTMTTLATSAEFAPGSSLTATASADAEYRNLHLQAAVSVTKSPSGDVRPGVAIPYTLSFTNTGERAFTDPVFRDRLPVDGQGRQLVFDPDRDPTVPPWSFALTGAAPNPPAGTPLPTDPDEVAVTEEGDVLVFRMPSGSVLEPGQTYTITLRLVLRPGLTPQDDVRNVASVAVDVPLDACVPTYDPLTAECSDDAVVSPLSIPALSTIKYVKADAAHGQTGIPEVIDTSGTGFDCGTAANADGFFRSPCVPVTLPGATETWRFAVTNAGTLPMDRLVAIDNLPTPGDQGLIVALPRGSAWQPTFVSGVALVGARPGAALSTFWSTSALPCVSDLNPISTGCDPAAWTPLEASTDPAAVRSLKIVVDFAPSALFVPGEVLNLQFQTRTTPAQRADTSLPIAWNTVATGGSALRGDARLVVPATEGRRVGVAYPTGSVALRKIVTGAAAGLAPDVFPVQLVCELDGAPIAGLPAIDLVVGADPVAVGGLPWGAVCTASEGRWGQTDQQIGSATVGGPDDGIGVITVENIFDVADLVVTKTVQTAAEDDRGRPIEYGPFRFSASCSFLGQPVFADGYGPDDPMVASFSPGETWALAGLPVGAECTVTEEDDLDARETSMIVSAGDQAAEPVPGTTVTVTIARDVVVSVEAVNVFGSGDLRLRKVVDGAAAEDFGAGPFTLFVQCELDTGSGPASVWSGRVSLGGDLPLEYLIEDIATGATCEVAEPDGAGATSTTIEPATVVIGDGQEVSVTVTNTFDAGSISVAKVIDGPGAELWGAGPFTVALSCETPLGEAVAIPGGAARVLRAENGFAATWSPLLIGLLCTITETEAGGATSTAITDADGVAIEQIEVVEGDVGVTVTNTFEVGGFIVRKTLSGADAAAHERDLFRILAACTWNGTAIEVPGGAERTLSVAAPVRFTGLPAGAVCTVAETDRGGAVAVRFSPVDPADPARARVTIGADDEVAVVVDNRFEPALPATGTDGQRWALIAGGAGLIALLGLVALVISRRRRQP